MQRGTRRFEYSATTADGRAWLAVTVYREVPDRWPSFDTDDIDAPAGKTIVLTTSDYTLD